MKNLKTTLALTGLLIGSGSFLDAQTPDPPPAAVPALASSVNLQIVLTTTGDETARGPETKKVHGAKPLTDRLNTRDFIRLLDEQHDLVAGQPNSYDLVAVLVETETENGYRFYLQKKNGNAAPAHILLSPEVLGLTVDATAMRYTEVQNGDTLLSGKGSFLHAVTLNSAGFETQGLAKGNYTVRDVTVDGVTAPLSVPSAMQVNTTGFYVKDAETPEARTYIAETRWVFPAPKPVNLNDYPAPLPEPEPEPEPEPATP